MIHLCHGMGKLVTPNILCEGNAPVTVPLSNHRNYALPIVEFNYPLWAKYLHTYYVPQFYAELLCGPLLAIIAEQNRLKRHLLNLLNPFRVEVMPPQGQRGIIMPDIILTTIRVSLGWDRRLYCTVLNSLLESITRMRKSNCVANFQSLFMTGWVHNKLFLISFRPYLLTCCQASKAQPLHSHPRTHVLGMLRRVISILYNKHKIIRGEPLQL